MSTKPKVASMQERVAAIMADLERDWSTLDFVSHDGNLEPFSETACFELLLNEVIDAAINKGFEVYGAYPPKPAVEITDITVK